MSENSETELMARCRNGDAAAWNTVFDLHYPAAARFVFQLSPEFTREEVEEICWEAFRSVVEFIDSFQEEHRFQSWLFRVAGKKTRDFREARPPGKPTAGYLAMVRKALDQLGDPCREIIELHYFGDLSHKDIGSMLSLTSNTVGVRLDKCLEELEEILDGYVFREKPPVPLPSRKSDELLKSWAKKRREDADPPMEMSSATREGLQVAVARIAKEIAPPPRRRSWLSDRARPAFVFALFFVLLITAASIWLRVHTSRPREITGRPWHPIVTVPDIPEKPPVKLANPESGSGAARRQAGGGATVTHRYSRKTDTETPALNDVLSSFRVEQSGDAMWIVDADGSIYADSAPRGTSFRATGTNRTLHQSVVFEGSFVADTNSAEGPMKSLIGKARIQGRVFVGTNDGVKIDAMAAR